MGIGKLEWVFMKYILYIYNEFVNSECRIDIFKNLKIDKLRIWEISFDLVLVRIVMLKWVLSDFFL